MRAVTISKPGDADVLAATEVDDPHPASGEVVVQVAASAVNRADVLQRRGFYDPPAGTVPFPGLECSGTVLEVGEGVDRWKIGDEVCALLTGGGYAERVAVPAGQVMPVPAGVGLIEAAALPEAACTVWSNVFMAAALRPTETLLVHGGSSGVGTMAIQLGRAVGAKVAVTAGTAAKLSRCAELGAEVLVNYKEQDFVAAVREATGGAGADVVLDIMGGSYLSRNVDVLATAGRLVVIGLQGGRRAELDLGVLLAKRAAVIATTLRFRPAGEKATIVTSVIEHVWPLIESGDVQPVIDSRFVLADVAAAHRRVESSEHVGKVLLTV